MPIDPTLKAKITARFNGRLPSVLEQLEQAHAAMVAKDPEGWAQARRHAHRLAGSAVNFGWPEITARSFTLLRSAEPDGLEPLRGLIEEVRRATEQCRAEPGSSPDA